MAVLDATDVDMTTGKAPIVTDAVEVPVPGKSVREFIGRVSSGDESVSIAVMGSPAGWTEPAQTPEFDEYTVVLKGELHVHLASETLTVAAGHAVHLVAGEQVRYATPDVDTDYVSVCMPACSPARVHRSE